MTAEIFDLYATHVKLQLNSETIIALNIEIHIPYEVCRIFSYDPGNILPLPLPEKNANTLTLPLIRCVCMTRLSMSVTLS